MHLWIYSVYFGINLKHYFLINKLLYFDYIWFRDTGTVLVYKYDWNCILYLVLLCHVVLLFQNLIFDIKSCKASFYCVIYLLFSCAKTYEKASINAIANLCSEKFNRVAHKSVITVGTVFINFWTNDCTKTLAGINIIFLKTVWQVIVQAK